MNDHNNNDNNDNNDDKENNNGNNNNQQPPPPQPIQQPYRPNGGESVQQTLTQMGVVETTKKATPLTKKKGRPLTKPQKRKNKTRKSNNSNGNNKNDNNNNVNNNIGTCKSCCNTCERLDKEGYCILCSQEELVSIYERNWTPEQIEELNKKTCCVCKQRVCINKTGFFNRCSHGSNKLGKQVRCAACRHDPACAQRAKYVVIYLFIIHVVVIYIVIINIVIIHVVVI